MRIGEGGSCGDISSGDMAKCKVVKRTIYIYHALDRDFLLSVDLHSTIQYHTFRNTSV
jgi:hypothetical protein